MKIAFVKYAGMASGGVEKYLQTIACKLVAEGYEVDFYYTNVAPDTFGTNFIHPDNDERNIKTCEKAGINLIKINVGRKNGGSEPYEWYDTDFWEKFDESKYDLITTGRGGYKEYPFTEIHNTPILDTIHSFTGYDKPNVKKAILLCQWQFDKWSENGGNKEKAVIIPSLVKIPKEANSCGDMREELGIQKETCVFGFHQGNRDDIFSHGSLSAYKAIEAEDNYFLVMGGSKKHRECAAQLGIKNIKFIGFSSDPLSIHRFLNTLDVFAHARADGEVCSAAMIEALCHGLPIISHAALNMGHVEQMDGCGFLKNNIADYAHTMAELQLDFDYRKYLSRKAKEQYEKKYEYDLVMDKILKVYKEAEQWS